MYVAAVFLPLIGSVIAGILAFASGIAKAKKRKSIDRSAQFVTVGAMLLSSIAGTVAFIDIVVNGNIGAIKFLTEVCNFRILGASTNKYKQDGFIFAQLDRSFK